MTAPLARSLLRAGRSLGLLLMLSTTLACSGAPARSSLPGPALSARPAPGLVVSESRILRRDGTLFRGRGVNLHDTRSCNACVTRTPDVAGLMRWSDELVDEWHVTFVRFLLSSWASADGYRLHYRRLLEDGAYVADVHRAVTHLTDKGVYVLVSVFAEPSILPDGPHPESEWPTRETLPVYALLAELFHDNPRVLFGLTNEPHGPASRDPELATRYLAAIDVIRAVEARHGADPHVVVVSAPQEYARDVSYFVDHPLPRAQIAYEIHPYNHAADFDRLVTRPSRVLPLIIGEYGPTKEMDEADVEALWALCDQLGLPHAAWNFHVRCQPGLLADDAPDGCGLARPRDKPFVRTPWGDRVFSYLRKMAGKQ